MNSLIISGGSFQGLTIIKGLRYSEKVRIVLADNSPETVGRYFVDKSYTVPKTVFKEQFIHTVMNICKEENIDIIFPSTQFELIPLAESSFLFKEKNIQVAVSEENVLRTLLNKKDTHNFLTVEKLPALPKIDITSDNFTFPVIGKPLQNWGSRGIIIANNTDELTTQNQYELVHDYIWHPYWKGFNEYSVDFAIDFKGTVSDFVIRRRIKTIGGFSVICESAENQKIQEIVSGLSRIISSRGGKGLFNVQILEKETNYFISDINPRAGTSAVFGFRHGVNFPLFLCSSVDESIGQIRNTPARVKMIRFLDELWIKKHDPTSIKGVVFDLDDTLLDHKKWILLKLEQLWIEFRDILPEREIFLLKAFQYIEEGNRSNLFDALCMEFEQCEQRRTDLIRRYREIIPDHCPLFPDSIPVLNGLREKGFKLALLTDNPPLSQKQKIDTCNLNELFDSIVYSREVDKEKPAGKGFRQVAENLAVTPGSLAMVGDNLYKDILGSLDAGYHHAYWISRKGTFYNFSTHILESVSNTDRNYSTIEDLRNILWSLEQ